MNDFVSVSGIEKIERDIKVEVSLRDIFDVLKGYALKCEDYDSDKFHISNRVLSYSDKYHKYDIKVIDDESYEVFSKIEELERILLGP